MTHRLSAMTGPFSTKNRLTAGDTDETCVGHAAGTGSGPVWGSPKPTNATRLLWPTSVGSTSTVEISPPRSTKIGGTFVPSSGVSDHSSIAIPWARKFSHESPTCGHCRFPRIATFDELSALYAARDTTTWPRCEFPAIRLLALPDRNRSQLCSPMDGLAVTANRRDLPGTKDDSVESFTTASPAGPNKANDTGAEQGEARGFGDGDGGEDVNPEVCGI